MLVTIEMATKPPKKRGIRVSCNIWGNYRGIVKNQTIFNTGELWDATHWLMELLDTGEYTLSDTSAVTQADVDAFRVEFNKTIIRRA